MSRPPIKLSEQEVQVLRECWESTGYVDQCRKMYAERMGLSKPPAWATVRKWIKEHEIAG